MHTSHVPPDAVTTSHAPEAPETSEPRQVFCHVCGSRLVDGACAACAVPQTAASPSSRRSRAATVAAAVVAAAAVAGLGEYRLTDARADHQRQVAALRTEARANTAAAEAARLSTNGLAERIATLEAAARDKPDPVAVAARVSDAVFTVRTDNGTGSAWAVPSTGSRSTLVTNFHVVAATWLDGGREVRVQRRDETFEGRIVGVDEANDLALVSVPNRLPVLTMAPRPPKVGDSVMAVGSPLGLGGTVSAGIVSAIREEEGTEYVQFSAPVSPGSSGGPLVNATGEVIGVTVAKVTGGGAEGLSFAIPIARLCDELVDC